MPLPYDYFVKTTTIVSAASDSNDGRDPLGCSLATASYDHTGGGTGERQLTAGSGTPFTNVQAGDYIYLVFGGGTSLDGCYEIETVSSSTVVLLAADTGLIDDSTSNVTSSDGPWLTLQYAFDTALTDGDHVVFCDDGNGTGTDWEYVPTLDMDVGNFDAGGRHFHGANGRGVVDGTVTTISGASHSGSTHLITANNATLDGQNFYDIRLTGAGSINLYAYIPTSMNAWGFHRCRIDNATGAGIQMRSYLWSFVDCEVDSNGSFGLTDGSTSPNNLRALWVRCRIHDNGGDGINAGSQGLIDCLVYDNAGDGYAIFGASPCPIQGSVFFGNTGDGISTGSGSWTANMGAGPLISNCVFRSNGGYGVNLSGYSTAVSPGIDYCCFHNNTSGPTSGAVEFLGKFPGEDNNIYVDPEFTSETDGSEDFTPADGSPLIDAGIMVAVL